MKYKLLDSCYIQIEAAESKHPNEMKFSGVLVRIDEVSSKAPNGSRGHRILIPSSLARKQLHTLIGMGINYSSDMKSHAPTRKVGVIKKAWIEGKDLKISGIIWKKDFPDAVKDLSKANLGMSFEASEISVEDENADIWIIKSLCFTGATILYKASAAYYKTSADAMAASAESLSPARLIQTESRRKFMANSKNKNRPGKKKISAGAGDTNEALVIAFSTALAPVLKELKANNKKLDTLQASFESLEASDEDVEDVDDEDVDDIDAEGDGMADDAMTSKKKVEAGKKKPKKDDEEDDDMDDDEDDDDDMDSEADDEDELDDLGEDDDDATDEESGKMNKDARTNKGRTVPSKPAGKKMHSSTAVRQIAKLTAANDQQAEEIEKLKKQALRNKKQLQAAGDRTDRKSISVSAILASTIAKGGVDLQAMSDSGEKMTVPEFDTICAANNVDGVTSMAMKNDLVRAGLMETGEVKSRFVNN